MDRLDLLRRKRFVGRQRELSQLERCAEPDGPAVTFLHGIGGMGKSALLAVLRDRLRGRGVRSVHLDARSFEPTPRGFWEALASELGLGAERGELTESESSPLQARAVGALAGTPGICILTIDHYELLRLLDSWLRQDFVPQLPARVRLILSGRHPPTAGWSTALGWQPLVQSCALQALDETASLALLENRHAPAPLVPGIVKFAQGHPLALELALAAAAERPGFDFEAPDRSRVIARLAQLFLQDLEDSRVRTALEAACVVRRASRSFLASLLGQDAAAQAMEHLGELGFIERTPEGLSLHPSVRQALEEELRAIDPVRHRELRRAAWIHMRRGLSSLGRAHLWQHAADALFLLEQDLVREAFFPSVRDLFVVERAQDRDWPEIASICGAYDSSEGVAVIGAFFQHARDAVHVARSERGEVAAFYVLSRSDQVPEPLLARDALVAAWVHHHPPSHAPALLLRRLLAQPARATRAEAYAACVRDLKRSYIENPSTTRLYAAASDVADHPEWGPLGFREQLGLVGPGLGLGGRPHSTFCLDFGAGGIFGWIGRLVDAQYESPEGLDTSSAPAEPAPVRSFGLQLDEDLRRLVLDGVEVALTPLQFNLLRHLSKHPERVIDRDELVQAVWGMAFVGSNVVDAAIRSLRKKLGGHANAIETVKGFGYRFRTTS
ncbi:MAG TPA: winged helix-turn-helix domain-containing protein [Polyangiaceae bacterium]|nr:winged helix-turn-helix domain-containing protein [Polyangiaceae bacterium]